MDFQEVFDVLVTSLLKLSVIIIPIIIGVLTPMLVKYLNELKKKLIAEGKNTELEYMAIVAELAISASEQLWETNEDKFNYAITELVRFANEANIQITHADATTLIEGSLKAIKQGLDPININQTPEFADEPKLSLLNRDPILND